MANEKSVTVKKYKSTPSWDQGWVVVTLCVSELINCCPTVESSRLSICHPYFKFLFSYFSVSPKLPSSNIFYMHLIFFPTSQVPLLPTSKICKREIWKLVRDTNISVSFENTIYFEWKMTTCVFSWLFWPGSPIKLLQMHVSWGPWLDWSCISWIEA